MEQYADPIETAVSAKIDVDHGTAASAFRNCEASVGRIALFGAEDVFP